MNTGMRYTFGKFKGKINFEIINLSGSFNFGFSCLSLQGDIYGVKGTLADIFKFNVSNETASKFGDIVKEKIFTFSGLLRAQNDFIYLIPLDNEKLIKIDSTNDTTINYDQMPAGVIALYQGGTLAPNGFIYAPPFVDNKIFKLNPLNDTYSQFGNIGIVQSDTNKFGSSALAPNGFIYAPPRNKGKILKIDPSNDTYIEFGNFSKEYFALRLSSNGCLYGLSIRSPFKILKIDPSNDTYIEFGNFIGEYRFFIQSTNGFMYSVSRNGSEIMKFNPLDDSFEEYKTGITTSIGSGQIAPNGNIYFLPDGSDKVIKITEDAPPLNSDQLLIPSDLNTLASSEFNVYR